PIAADRSGTFLWFGQYLSEKWLYILYRGQKRVGYPACFLFHYSRASGSLRQGDDSLKDFPASYMKYYRCFQVQQSVLVHFAFHEGPLTDELQHDALMENL